MTTLETAPTTTTSMTDTVNQAASEAGSYQVLRSTLRPHEWANWLNDMARQGWEAVQYEPVFDEALGGYVPQRGYIWLFRRRGTVFPPLETPEARVAEASAQTKGQVYLPPSKAARKEEG